MAHLVLFDGVCCLCNTTVHFILGGKHADRFLFAPLQSDVADEVAERYRIQVRKFSTMIVIANYEADNSRVLTKGRAALFILDQMGGVWRFATVFRVLPNRALDALYDLLARYRYRIFGKLESCPIPEPKDRSRFLA